MAYIGIIGNDLSNLEKRKMTLRLSPKEIAVNARKAFVEGRLQAQVNSGSETCDYLGPCAIGVSITDKALAAKLDETQMTISAAHANGLLIVEGCTLAKGPVVFADDIGLAVSNLQRVHDSWVNESVGPREFEEALVRLETLVGA